MRNIWNILCLWIFLSVEGQYRVPYYETISLTCSEHGNNWMGIWSTNGTSILAQNVLLECEDHQTCKVPNPDVACVDMYQQFISTTAPTRKVYGIHLDCDSKSESDVPSSVHVLAAVLLPLILGSAVTLGLLYYIWHRKTHLVMNIAHRAHRSDEKETYQFDAFVSYKACEEDEHFVVRQLYRKLEVEMGYKLCLHFKDFLVGAPITENVIWAIKNSRHTILVLSPDFVTSEWTKFEYQVAQQEMLRERQRIIPIIFREFDRKHIDENLQIILSSITYMTWPSTENGQRKFWARLAQTLPKQKTRASAV